LESHATGSALPLSIVANGPLTPDSKEKQMNINFGDLIPMVLFVCIVMAIKVVVEARLRKKMVENHVSEDLVKSMLVADEQARRLSALKWGLVLTTVGVAFGLVSALRLDSDNPGTFGLLIGAAGVGMLAYHFIANRAK